MTSYSFGDIILVPFPFTDQTDAKKRPAVVVSADRYHDARPDLIIMAVTSQLRISSRVDGLIIDAWREASLPKPSTVKPLLASIARPLVIRSLGKLTDEDCRSLRTWIPLLLG